MSTQTIGTPITLQEASDLTGFAVNTLIHARWKGAFVRAGVGKVTRESVEDWMSERQELTAIKTTRRSEREREVRRIELGPVTTHHCRRHPRPQICPLDGSWDCDRSTDAYVEAKEALSAHRRTGWRVRHGGEAFERWNQRDIELRQTLNKLTQSGQRWVVS